MTLPPCRGAGLHVVHESELHHFKQRVWSVRELKGYKLEDTADPGYVTVVNATGRGAEVVARAWCSESGMDATIPRPGGSCFACAVQTTDASIDALIWVGEPLVRAKARSRRSLVSYSLPQDCRR